MKPAKALQAALTADKNRQMVTLLNQTCHRYGVNAMLQMQAWLWWGWPITKGWKVRPWIKDDET